MITILRRPFASIFRSLTWRSRSLHDLAAKTCSAHKFVICSRILQLFDRNDHYIEMMCHYLAHCLALCVLYCTILCTLQVQTLLSIRQPIFKQARKTARHYTKEKGGHRFQVGWILTAETVSVHGSLKGLCGASISVKRIWLQGSRSTIVSGLVCNNVIDVYYYSCCLL